MAMVKEVKEKWVKALRSGKYRQGRNHLRRGTFSGYNSYYQREGEFCCLGVLCEIACSEGVIPAPRKVNDEYYYYDTNSFSLPLIVSDWAGLESDKEPFGAQNTLIGMNDMRPEQIPFTQIADWIESNL